jgi:Mrp family chromosome partitioning ATPase
MAPGLDLIVAHGVVSNAQDLLGSDQMKKMIQEAAKNYDLVIIDTPPILAVSDAIMIMPVVDTTIFLVKWAETPREVAAQAIKQIKTAGLRVAGVVLTQVDLFEHAKYSYSGRGYTYEQHNQYYAN